MSSSAKANGKAKQVPTSRYLHTSSVGPFKLGLSQVKPYGDAPEAIPTKDRSEGWWQMQGVTGTRARLIADEWEGLSSKWNIQYESRPSVYPSRADKQYIEQDVSE